MLIALLSGALGAILGVIGALLATRMTIRSETDRELKQRRHEVDLTRLVKTLDTSGSIAQTLVQFYDALRETEVEHSGDEHVDVTRLKPLVEALRRIITVDAPVLDAGVETDLQEARDEVFRRIPRGVAQITMADLLELTQIVRDAGDALRESRRALYATYKQGLQQQ